MIELQPFTREHLDTFRAGERERDLGYRDDVEFLDAVAELWEGKALSATENGKTLAVMAVVTINGAPRLSMIMSDEVRARPFTLHREVVRRLPPAMQVMGLGYVEMSVLDEVAGRWAEHLGFTPTADKPGIYARVF